MSEIERYDINENWAHSGIMTGAGRIDTWKCRADDKYLRKSNDGGRKLQGTHPLGNDKSSLLEGKIFQGEQE